MQGRRVFASRLLDWGRENRRVLPWREEHDPFRVLVAEVLLQRSRARTVAFVYEDLFARWPTARDLASAPVSEIEQVIRPIGLVRRAEHLKHLAERIEEQGGVPVSLTGLQGLPGVGRYASMAALASFTPEAEAAVDSVSARVYRRFFGLENRLEASEDVQLWQVVAAVVPYGDARELNWAALDLAAAVCLPKKPRCWTCPLQPSCRWANDNG
jgi:A/G-specific adenine glycosylase